MMTILAVGDSITYGSELPDLPGLLAGRYGNDFVLKDPNTGHITFTTSPPSKLAWPNKLAELMGTDVDNLGLTGCGNDRIFRKALKHSAEKQYDLVVVAWSEVSRFDFAFEGKEMPVSLVNLKDFGWTKEFMTNHYDRRQCIERTLCFIIALQNHFKQVGQRYLFVNAMPLNLPKLHPATQLLIQLIDQSNYIDFDSGMIEWGSTANVPHGPYGHFLEQGHQLVADKIFEFIQNQR